MIMILSAFLTIAEDIMNHIMMNIIAHMMETILQQEWGSDQEDKIRWVSNLFLNKIFYHLVSKRMKKLFIRHKERLTKFLLSI